MNNMKERELAALPLGASTSKNVAGGGASQLNLSS